MLLNSTQLSANERWLVMGDSLSAAYGIQNDLGWVRLLEQRLAERDLDVEIINASLSGETTSGGLARFPKLIDQYSPALVIIELGANDALRGQNLSITEQNLRSMILLSQQKSAKAVLLGIRLPTNYGPIYDQMLAQMFARLAKQFNLTFDPFFLQDVALDEKLMQSDGLHPNAQAQPIIMQRVWKLLSIERLNH